MRINKPRTLKPRKKRVQYGDDSHGKRKIVQDVMACGASRRVAEKAVNAVFRKWTEAILAKDQHIEMPIGHLKVKKTPKHLYRKRYATKKLFGKPLPHLITWTIYNDLYRIIWRVPADEWEQLLANFNPPLTPEPDTPKAPRPGPIPGLFESTGDCL